MAHRRGLDLSAHLSVVLDDEVIGNADIIFVMSRRQQRDLMRQFGRSEDVFVLGDGDPLAIESRTIKDPVEKPESVFEVVYDRVDRCCALVVASLVEETLGTSMATPSESEVEASRDHRPIRMVAGR